MVSVRSEKLICAPPRLSDVSTVDVAFETVHLCLGVDLLLMGSRWVCLPRTQSVAKWDLNGSCSAQSMLVACMLSVLQDREDHIILRYLRRGNLRACTLRASLSGTFLQTLPDLVTPLQGHSSSPRSCPPTRSAPSERFGYYDCGSNLAPKHARKHETHPPRVKKKKKKKKEEEEKEFRLDSNDCGFICAGVNFVGGYKWHALFYLSCL